MKGLLTLAVPLLASCSADRTQTLSSPDGNIEINFTLTPDGQPTYSATYKNRTVVATSLMGFDLRDAEPLTEGFHIDGVDRSSFNETWTPVWGENDSIVNGRRPYGMVDSRRLRHTGI